MSNFIIDSLKSNSNRVLTIHYAFKVNGQNKSGIKGLLTSSLTMPGTNNFSSRSDLSAQSRLTKALNSMIGVGNTISSWMDGGTVPQVKLEHPAQTIYQWTGSNRPSFSLDMLLLAVRPEDDVRSDVNALLRMVYPRQAKGGGQSNQYVRYIVESVAEAVLVAPLDYAPPLKPNDKGVKGTFRVSIGSWFSAPQQVMKSVSATFSTEVTSRGAPVYAAVKLQFEPYKMVNVDEIVGYLKGG